EEVIDLSVGGMFVSGHGDGRVGDPVLVSLRAPGTRFWLDAEGEVTRVVRGLRFSDRGRSGFAVRFREIDPASQAVLSASLARRPPPIPRRPLRRNYALTVQLIWAY